MNRGFSSEIPKPNDKVRSGTRAIHRARRKQERADRKLNPCYFFFYSQGVVHKEFVRQEQTVNQQCYREVLERLRERVHRVRPETADTSMLHHTTLPVTLSSP